MTVRIAGGYDPMKGIVGRSYRYIGDNVDGQDLRTINYKETGNWKLVEISLSIREAGNSWTLVAPDGTSYVLELNSEGKLAVARSTVNAVVAAASLSAAFGGTTGVALSGAGAIAENVILSNTSARVLSSTIR